MSKPLDYRGREIDLGNYSGDPKEGLAKSMLSSVKKIMENKPASSNKPSDELVDIVKKLAETIEGQTLDEQFEEFSKTVNDTLNFQKKINQTENKTRKSIKDGTMWAAKLYKASQSKHSLHTHVNNIQDFADAINKSFKDADITKLINAINKDRFHYGGRGGGGGGRGGKGGGGGFDDMDPKEFNEMVRMGAQFYKKKSMEKAADDLLKKGMSILSGALGMTVIGQALDVSTKVQEFAEIVKSEEQFRLGMKSIMIGTTMASEQTQDMVNTYINLGAVAHRTGMDRIVMQQVLEKELKKGLKTESKNLSTEELRNVEMKDFQDVLMSSLSVSNQLGISAESSSNYFTKMRREMGFTALGAGQLVRDMKAVAQSSGLFGDSLMSAFEASDKVVKSLRDSGNLTNQNMRNVVKIMASAQKNDVADTMEPILKAMSSFKAYTEASDDVKRQLAQIYGNDSAAMRNVMMGQGLKNPNVAKDMESKLRDRSNKVLMDALISRSSTVGGKTMIGDNELKNGKIITSTGKVIEASVENFQALSMKFPELMQQANLNLAKTVGMEGDVVARSLETLKEAGMSTTDSINKLEKQRVELRNSGKLTGVKDKQITEQVEELKVNDFMDKLTGTIQHMKAGTFEEALVNAGYKDKKEFQEGMKSGFDPFIKKAETVLGSGATLKETGFTQKQLQDMITSGKESEMMQAQQAINTLSQTIATAEKNSKDTVWQIQQDVREIKDSLGRGLGSLLSNSFTQMGIAVAAITGGIWTLGKGGLGIIDKIRLALGGVPGAGYVGAAGGALKGMAGSAIRGVGSVLSGGARLAGNAVVGGANLAGNMVGGGARMAGKAVGGLGSMAGGLSLGNFGSMISGFSKYLPLIGGAITGLVEAKSEGKSLLEGGIYGALTGSAGTGSTIGRMTGATEKGTVADQLAGVLESFGYGAMAGKQFGPGGAMIGGAIGMGAKTINNAQETYKVYSDIKQINLEIEESLKKNSKLIESNQASVLGKFDGMADDQNKLAEMKDQLLNERNKLEGAKHQVSIEQSEIDERGFLSNYFDMTGAKQRKDAATADISRHQGSVDTLQNKITELEKNLADQKAKEDAKKNVSAQGLGALDPKASSEAFGAGMADLDGITNVKGVNDPSIRPKESYKPDDKLASGFEKLFAIMENGIKSIIDGLKNVDCCAEGSVDKTSEFSDSSVAKQMISTMNLGAFDNTSVKEAFTNASVKETLEQQVFGMNSNTLDKLVQEMSGTEIGGKLNQMRETLNNNTSKSLVSTQNLGAFDNTSIKEASSVASNTMSSETSLTDMLSNVGSYIVKIIDDKFRVNDKFDSMKESILNGVSASSQVAMQMIGAFDSNASKEALSPANSSLVKEITAGFDHSKESRLISNKGHVVDSMVGMNKDKITAFTKLIESTTASDKEILNATSILGERERAEVNTRSIPGVDLEQRIERDREVSETKTIATIASMEAMKDYFLIEQKSLLTDMRDSMETVASALTAKRTSSVGNVSSNLRSSMKMLPMVAHSPDFAETPYSGPNTGNDLNPVVGLT